MNWELQDFGEEDPQLLGGEGLKDHHAHFFHQVIHIYHHINLWLSCSPQGNKPPQVHSVKQSEATLVGQQPAVVRVWDPHWSQTERELDWCCVF